MLSDWVQTLTAKQQRKLLAFLLVNIYPEQLEIIENEHDLLDDDEFYFGLADALGITNTGDDAREAIYEELENE